MSIYNLEMESCHAMGKMQISLVQAVRYMSADFDFRCTETSLMLAWKGCICGCALKTPCSLIKECH